MRRDVRQLGQWRDECVRLRAGLAAILDCTDPHCTLCARCLDALRPPVVVREPPVAAPEDPVRVYTRRWPHRSAKPAA